MFDQLCEPIQNLFHIIDSLWLRKSLTFLQQFPQVSILGQLLNNVHITRSFLNFNTFDDVGRFKVFEDFYLPNESVFGVLILSN